ncbi:phage tail length tape measure family protein [Pseudomonas sp. TYF_14]|uniref:phage tail length tape measure family protein n=1 Tax=Pseudomonas sp. TYF_14 TaxID=3367193 RepID=UPI00370A43C1
MALKSRLELEVDGRSAEQQVNSVRAALEALEQVGVRANSTLRKSGSDYTNLAMALAKVQAANDKASAATESAAKSADAAAKAAATQRKELDSLLGKIEPLTKKLNDLAAQELALVKARDSGQINQAVYDSYNRKLQESLNALSGVSNAQKVVGETAEQAKARILAIAEASVKAAQAQRNLANVATGLSEADQGLLSGSMVLAANQGKLAESTQKVAEANRQARAATVAQAQGLKELLASIDPATKALNRLDEQERKLAQQKKRGALDAETFSHYQAKIDQARAALTGLDQSLTRTGNTAKQNAAALRMLPAQFSDVVISLQAGQSPLTVFLQQGSQIKDSFGGMGQAARATSSYILGLVSPLTIAAAAAGVLALAYKQGSDEATAFNASLALTGNTAGTTTEQLAGMAEQASAAGGTVGKAAAVLAQLAASTRIPVSAFESITRAAIDFESATGQAAEETVKNFERIAKDPVAEILKLNESMNFLTASTYEQIKALQEQGKTQAAAELANDAYEQGLNRTSKGVRDNLGYIEASWKAVTGAAKAAWDAALNVGREKTLDEQLKALDEQLATIAEAANRRTQRTPNGGKADPISNLAPADTFRQEALEAEKTQLLIMKAEKDRRAMAQGLAQQQQKQSLDDQLALDKLRESSENNAAKREKALAEYRLLVERRVTEARVKNDQSLLISAEQQAKDIAAINEKYKDPKTPKGPQYREDAGLRMLDEAKRTQAVLIQQNSLINAQGVATERVGVQAQALIKWEQQLSDLKSKKTLTADQKSLLASQDLITAQLKRNAELERQAELSKGIVQAQKDQVQLLTLTGQLREANSLKSSLEDAALIAEYERQGNVEAVKRLQTLIKIRDINLQAAQKPGTVEGVTKAPDTPGLDASVGGAGSEIDRLAEAAQKLETWRATELEKQKAYLDLKAINEETYAARVANIDDQTQKERAKIDEATNRALLSGASTFFDNMSSLSQSSNKRLAAIGKAAAITQATIDGYLAVQKALAAFPPPFNFAAAAAVGVATAANVANIAGIGFSEGGYTGPGGVNDPAGVVHKGEVVWSQADIRRFGGVSAVEALRTGNVALAGATQASGRSQAISQDVRKPQAAHQVFIVNNSNAVVETRTGEGGRLEVLVQAVEDRLVDQMAAGWGSFVEVTEQAYGLKRQGS